MKNYTIVLNKNFDKKEFISDMQNISTMEFVPNRSCEIVDIKESRCLTTKLSDQEVSDLANDPRIQKMAIIPPMELEPLGFFPDQGVPRKFSPKPFFFDNNTEKKEIDKNISFTSQALSQNANIGEIPNGSGVDVVIIDGIIAGMAINQSGCTGGGAINMSGTSPIVHPEFRDSQGNSRIELINWNSYVSESGDYPYNEIIENNQYLFGNSHGIHVAGTVCGKNFGWVKGSKIYNISPYAGPLTTDFKYLTAVKNWHLTKGNDRPTITNNSYGFSTPPYDIRYVNKVTVNSIEYIAPREQVIGVLHANIDSSGHISSFDIVNAGSGYTNMPDISYNGGGGDEAILIMASGTVKEVSVTDTGSGYDPLNPPAMVFSPSQNGVTASGICFVDEYGKIYDIEVLDWGTGYDNPPTITFDDPVSGTTATATTTIGSNFISKIQIINSAPSEGRQAISAQIDPPHLIISGGDCIKDALWTFSNSSFVMDDWYGSGTDVGGVIVDGMYKIATKKTVIDNNSFNYTLLGGQYNSQPNVSFRYMFNDGPLPGPLYSVFISNGQISSVSGQWINDTANLLGGSGWFTSEPQVFLTNGGGFTKQELNNWGVQTFKPFDGNPISDYYSTYVWYAPGRNIVMDSIIEDMVNAGIVVVAAAGNNAYECKNTTDPGYDTTLEANLCYIYKENPSRLFDDSTTLPNHGFYMYYYYSIYGTNLLWGDNIYSFNPLQGSSPGASDGSICVGSLSWECCPETKSSFSNTGKRIDIYAAGDNISSAWYLNKSCYSIQQQDGESDHPEDSRFGIKKLSGTSMASPQVCGAIASYFTEGNVARSQNIPEQALTWVTGNAISSLSDSPFPLDLKSGTDKVLYYPNISVTLQ